MTDKSKKRGLRHVAVGGDSMKKPTSVDAGSKIKRLQGLATEPGLEAPLSWTKRLRGGARGQRKDNR